MKSYRYFVTEQDLEKVDSTLNREKYISGCLVMYSLALVIFYFCFFKGFQLKSIPNYFRMFNNARKKFNLTQEELSKLIKDCEKLINSNAQLKKCFDEFCKESGLFDIDVLDINSNFNNIDDLKLKLNLK